MLDCSERIHDSFLSRIEYIDGLFKRIDKIDTDEDIEDSENALDELLSLPLSTETCTKTKILLSTGGPEDFIDVFHNDGDVIKMVYNFNDWFDHAEIDISTNEVVEMFVREILGRF